VERHVHPDAFVFPSAETAVRYYASGMIDTIANRPADNARREKLLPLVAEEIERVVKAEGVFRDPKDAGCFVVSASELTRVSGSSAPPPERRSGGADT